MGSSTAWELSKNAANVLLIEQQGTVYTKGSSFGESRISRSLGSKNDIFSYLQQTSVIETQHLVDFLNEFDSARNHCMEDITAVSDAVRRSRAGLQNPKKPIGTFLFLGTTGIGKTELAKALAEYLFDDENAMTRIDMSEYQERHAVSRLVGAPPGYVGYDEGGQLTEAVRRKPYSVVLLDEIEKAHPDIFNVMLQVLDEGHLTDNKGRVADFKNTIIIMTSNLGSQMIQERFEATKDLNTAIEGAKLDVLGLLKQSVRPEFLNRIDDIIMFTPLDKNDITTIVGLQLKSIIKIIAQQGITFDATKEAISYLAEKGFNPEYGARPVKRVIQKEVLNELSKDILAGKINTDSIILLDAFDDKLVFRNQDDLVNEM